MKDKEVKFIEACNEEAGTLLDNVKFANAKSEIECMEIVSALIQNIEKKAIKIKKLKSKAETYKCCAEYLRNRLNESTSNGKVERL